MLSLLGRIILSEKSANFSGSRSLGLSHDLIRKVCQLFGIMLRASPDRPAAQRNAPERHPRAYAPKLRKRFEMPDRDYPNHNSLAIMSSVLKSLFLFFGIIEGDESAEIQARHEHDCSVLAPPPAWQHCGMGWDEDHGTRLPSAHRTGGLDTGAEAFRSRSIQGDAIALYAKP